MISRVLYVEQASTDGSAAGRDIKHDNKDDNSQSGQASSPINKQSNHRGLIEWKQPMYLYSSPSVCVRNT